MKIKYNYQTFGLKENWINMLFLSNNNFITNCNLGKNQIISFFSYLKDLELYYNKQLSDLFFLIKKNKNNKVELWSIFLINLFFNSPTFFTFTLLPKGKYSFIDLKNFYISIFKYNSIRTINSAITSLLSTFENTPIGNDLKIGIIIKEKKRRSVIKEGGFKFNPYIILYAIYKYAYKNNIFEINIDKIENDLFSPQKVLVVDSKYIKNCLLDLQHLDIFEIDINNNNSFFIKLKEIKSPYEVIKILFAKEKL